MTELVNERQLATMNKLPVSPAISARSTLRPELERVKKRTDLEDEADFLQSQIGQLFVAAVCIDDFAKHLYAATRCRIDRAQNVEQGGLAQRERAQNTEGRVSGPSPTETGSAKACAPYASQCLGVLFLRPTARES